MALTQVSSGLIDSTAQYTGFKNRIINGDMRIDQRNAGASVTPTAINGQYTLDRWDSNNSAASKYSIQRNAGSVTPPVGFINYLGVTSLATTTVGSTDYYQITQAIEGLNCADLAWGTANAATVTLSFWVRSSLTGTFGGSINNSAENRSYPFSYTIASANTWEQKTITIAGDTTGTWLTTNGTGMKVRFSMGMGSTYSGTAGAWANGIYASATGATNVVSTNGATFYITGVMLEKGSTATSFDYRPYTTEQQLCYRYYYKPNGGSMGAYIGSTTVTAFYPFKVSMRATPTSSGTSATMEGTRPFVAGGITGQYNSAEAVSSEYYCINYSGLSSSSSSGQPFVINTDDVQFSAEL